MKINCVYTELKPIEHIIPNPKNPNKHSSEQIARLAKIIEFQGQRRPLIISRRSGFLVTGHATLEAIKKLGWNEAAVDFQEFDNEAQEYAFVVADNEIAHWASTDIDIFKTTIEDLDFNPDLELFGFKENIDQLFMDNPLEELDEVEKEESSKGLSIKVDFATREEFQELYDELTGRGYIVRAL